MQIKPPCNQLSYSIYMTDIDTEMMILFFLLFLCFFLNTSNFIILRLFQPQVGHA